MILVTGGLGFIGSHIALSLLARGHEIVIVDNLANSTLQTLERLEYISGMYIPFAKLDVRNTPALNKVFEQYSIDAVIHTASFKSLEESVLKPLEYYNDNVSCIMSLLRAMQRMGVRQLINLSSVAVYGKSDSELSEETEFNYHYANPYIVPSKWWRILLRIPTGLTMNGRSLTCGYPILSVPLSMGYWVNMLFNYRRILCLWPCR